MMAAIRVGLESALKADRRRPAAHAKLVDFVLVGVTGVLVLAVIGLSAFATLFSRAATPSPTGSGSKSSRARPERSSVTSCSSFSSG